MNVEVAAYKKQIAFYGPGHSIDFAVKCLMDDYGLSLTEQQARDLLTK
jgi:hypothetical protein